MTRRAFLSALAALVAASREKSLRWVPRFARVPLTYRGTPLMVDKNVPAGVMFYGGHLDGQMKLVCISREYLNPLSSGGAVVYERYDAISPGEARYTGLRHA